MPCADRGCAEYKPGCGEYCCRSCRTRVRQIGFANITKRERENVWDLQTRASEAYEVWQNALAVCPPPEAAENCASRRCKHHKEDKKTREFCCGSCEASFRFACATVEVREAKDIAGRVSAMADELFSTWLNDLAADGRSISGRAPDGRAH